MSNATRSWRDHRGAIAGGHFTRSESTNSGLAQSHGPLPSHIALRAGAEP